MEVLAAASDSFSTSVSNSKGSSFSSSAVPVSPLSKQRERRHWYFPHLIQSSLLHIPNHLEGFLKC